MSWSWGKSAFIVMDDADLSLATMFSGFTICSHAGPGLRHHQRLLVPEAKLDEAVEQVAGVLAVPYGDPATRAR